MKIQSVGNSLLPISTQPPASRPENGSEASTPAEVEKLSPQAAGSLVQRMNETLKTINTGLEFSLQEDTGQMVIKVVDLETKEILRQFPSEEAIAIARALDKLKGVLVRQSA